MTALTLAVAVLGAVLGVINTWRLVDSSRVKLRVVPVHVIIPHDPTLRFGIEVINLSAFAVTVCDVGVMFRGSSERGTYLLPTTSDNGPWPRRLEPRSTVSLRMDRPTAPPGHPIKCAFAMTACGVTKRGTSKALKQIARGQ